MLGASLLVLALHTILATAQTQVCNNAASLCSRSYSNITYLGAHDSPYVRNSTNGYSIAGNHYYTTIQQLDSGVRLISAQVHAVTTNGQTQWRLCHSLCQLYDAGLLVDWLRDIKNWLDRNPNDVITILLVNSDNASAATLDAIYRSSGLDTLSYSPPSLTIAPSTWPTLRDMISSKKRVVNFIADLTPSTSGPSYLLNEFTFVFENSYSNYQPSDFSCDPDRPPTLKGNTRGALTASYLPLMNHFLYADINGISIPAVERANVTNAPTGAAGNLGSALANCSRVYGKAPVFVLTDFSNVGPAIDAVDRVNGVSGATTGRLVLPDSVAAAVANPSPTSVQGGMSATGTGTGSTRSATTGTGAASATAGGAGTSSSSVSASGGRIRVGGGGNDAVLQLGVASGAIAVVAGLMLMA